MTEFLEGLAMLLDARGVALYSSSANSSIFLDFLPERAEHALSLTTYGADPEAPGRGRIWPYVQVRARGDRLSPRWSREAIQRVYRALHGFRGVLPNGVEAIYLDGQQSAPLSLGPDRAGRYEHTTNFRCWICDPVLSETSDART